MGMRQLRISHSITNRESESLEKYLREISRIELLSPEEEVILAMKIAQGDNAALDRLTRANLRFVVSVAKQYQGQGLSLPDLINEGNMGLIKAAKRFDHTRGFKFISFAVWWIRQFIVHALAEHARLVRVPMNKMTLNNRIQKTQTELEQKLERIPSDDELAEALNMSVPDIAAGKSYTTRHVSLDSPVSGDEESATLLDSLENREVPDTDEKVSYSYSLRKEVNRLLVTLNANQKKTICYYFGIGVEYPMSLDEIARRLEVTPERVRQIRDAALKQLRGKEQSSLLRGFICR